MRRRGRAEIIREKVELVERKRGKWTVLGRSCAREGEGDGDGGKERRGATAIHQLQDLDKTHDQARPRVENNKHFTAGTAFHLKLCNPGLRVSHVMCIIFYTTSHPSYSL